MEWTLEAVDELFPGSHLWKKFTCCNSLRQFSKVKPILFLKALLFKRGERKILKLEFSLDFR
jgi:hypothetical protein